MLSGVETFSLGNEIVSVMKMSQNSLPAVKNSDAIPPTVGSTLQKSAIPPTVP